MGEEEGGGQQGNVITTEGVGTVFLLKRCQTRPEGMGAVIPLKRRRAWFILLVILCSLMRVLLLVILHPHLLHMKMMTEEWGQIGGGRIRGQWKWGKLANAGKFIIVLV